MAKKNPIIAEMKVRIVSLLIVLFSLSQVSGLIISISNLSKDNISVSQNPMGSNMLEEEETEHDFELEDIYCSYTVMPLPIDGKRYTAWKEKVFASSKTLPEVPPPNRL